MKRTGASAEGTTGWQAIRSAFLAGEYTVCRRLLEARSGDPQGQIWLARIEAREGQNGAALGRALSLQNLDERTAAERDVLAANEYGQTGDAAHAHSLLDRALPVLKPFGEPYYRGLQVRALIYFLTGDYERDERTLSLLAESPDPRHRAAAHAHRAWIAVKREDLHMQLRHFLRALDEYEATPEPDQYSYANTLAALGALCRETPVEADVIERLRFNAARLHRSEGNNFSYFQLTRILGWIDALAGDGIAAMRRWRTAEEIAPSEYWRVFSLVDRAYFAAAMRRPAAGEMLDTADAAASALAWGNTQDEQRMILLTLAQLYAARDPSRAERYLATYRTLPTRMDPRIGFVGDRRTRALQAYPQGVAQLQLGEHDAAVRLLEEAWSIFSDFNYGWRAALTALALHGATGNPVWLHRADARIVPWPRSWIARDIREAKGE